MWHVWGEMWGTYRVLCGNPRGKRSLGGPRRRFVDDIKIDHKEMEWVSVDWIDLAQDRGKQWALPNTVMNLNAGNSWLYEGLLATPEGLHSITSSVSYLFG